MKIEWYGKTYEWDEEAKAETHNISDRKLCLSHDFINASLYFGRKAPNGNDIHISIEERHADKHFTGPWGGGYGGIRFCRKCKLIECIHFWKESVSDISWKSCEHEWSGGLTRSDNNNGAEWRCLKCGAVYRFMCGHGGSLYVCDPCYKLVTENMVKEDGSIEKHLSKHCSNPEIPIIQTCVHCERRITTWHR